MALLVLDTVGSTMDAARDLLLSGQLTPDAQGGLSPSGVLALDQTAGRGQRGRTWFAEPGQNLSCTYIMPITQQEKASPGWVALAAGAAALQATEPYCRTGSKLQLKWPNDLLLNGKKLGGILIEVCSAPWNEPVTLVGVGINLHGRCFPAEIAASSTSIALEGGVAPDAPTVGDAVAAALAVEFSRVRQLGFKTLLDMWQKYDATRGRSYSVSNPAGTITGTAEGITERGTLLIRQANGELTEVVSAGVITEQ